jgi:hypothetical protein
MGSSAAASSSPWRPPSAAPPCSTRLVDHTGLGRAGAEPYYYRSLSRAAGPGLLLLHGAETVSPGNELTAAAAVGSSSRCGHGSGDSLPPLTSSLGDRRSGAAVARPPQPVFAGSGRFWGLCKEQPELWR